MRAVIVFDHEPPDHLQPAAPRQIEIHDDEVRAVFLETRDGFLRRRRFADLGVWFDGDQAPETGMNNRVVVDDENFHASPDKGRGASPIAWRREWEGLQ